MVRVKFHDGTTATANLVVGCDGIHSSIRSQFISDDHTYSGRIAYRGLVPIEKIEAWWPLESYSASWLCKDRHLLVFPISRNKTLNIVAFVTKAKSKVNGMRESWNATGERSELEKDFEDFEETIQRVIACMPSQPSKWLLNDHEPLEQWIFCNGKVVLMGDAAHAMLPHQDTISSEHEKLLTIDTDIGAGAGQAIEDGYILGRAMHDFLTSTAASDKSDFEPWARLYQSVRLPRAQMAQKTAREVGDIYEMQADDMRSLTYDECIPKVRERLKDRMKW